MAGLIIESPSRAGHHKDAVPPAPVVEHSLRHPTPVASEDAGQRRGDDPSQPWLDDRGDVVWSWPRIYVCRVIDAQWFETCMAVVIIMNICLIVMETDLEALCYPAYIGRIQECPYIEAKSSPWLKTVNFVLLCVYTVEAGLHLFVERGAYLKNSWNSLDAFIVCTGWVGMIVGKVVNVAFLRFFRVARLARALRVFIAFRELYLLLAGLLSALRTIMWGTFMLFGILMLWGILMVEFVHPVNSRIDFGEDCERCPRGFATVMSSVLTLFQQIVTGDSWGTINIPLIEEAPWTSLLLIAATLMVSYGLTNLILAVIVERAAEARERDLDEKLKQKELEQENQKSALYNLCRRMDSDGSGTLDLKELLDSYETNTDFRNTLNIMDIQREELKAVFKVLDTDGSGDVDYKEFCDQLHQIRTRDTRTMLTFLKLAVNEVQEEVASLVREVRKNPKEQEPFASPQHSQVLASIDDRLHKLCAASTGSIGSGAAPMTGILRSSGGGLPPMQPVAPPQPWAAPERELSVDSVLADIHGLGSSTQELAGLKGTIVRRLEDQVATLTRQAGVLASIGVSVKSGTGLPEQGVVGLPDGQLVRVGEKLSRLQENMQHELSALLKEVDQRLEDGAATIARNTELLASLSTDLGCRPSSQDRRDSKQKTMVSSFSEPKARERQRLPSVGGGGGTAGVGVAPFGGHGPGGFPACSACPANPSSRDRERIEVGAHSLV
mmetsp:Transcript_72291/g.182278  ORF Transcript_72291/g.182278 Transcript_72291/m.182278 type:complete len:724 (+) Transcript_72291:112-2283(+)